MRRATNRRSLLRSLAAGSLTVGVAGIVHGSQETDSDDFDPNLHGFGFPNWSTTVPRFPDHDHDTISETQIQRTIRRKWRDPMERLLDVDLGATPGVLIDTIAKQLYVSVNQLSGTNGHCYGMVFAAQQYYERPETLPLEVESASEIEHPSEPLDDSGLAPVGEEIDLFHITQYLDPNAWIGRRQLNWPSTIDYRRQLAEVRSVVEEYGTAGITLFETGTRQSHQVLVYDTQSTDEGVRLFVYDPNRKAGRYGGDAGTPQIDVNPDAESPVSYTLNPTYEHFVFNRRDRVVAARAAATTATESQLPAFGDDLLRVGLFLLESEHACLNVVDPDGEPVGRDTATFQDREHTEYDAMRYRYGVDPGQYRLAVIGKHKTDYTLTVQAADQSGELVQESVTETLGAGETHEYAAMIPANADERGSLERVGTGTPRWLLALGGVGAAAVGAAAYRHLGRDDEQ